MGPRTAERYAYYLFKAGDDKAAGIANNLTALKSGIKICPVTYALIDSNQKVSSLYSDSDRDKSIIAVVEDSFDVVALEKTRAYKRTYHVLGGLISPIDNLTRTSFISPNC